MLLASFDSSGSNFGPGSDVLDSVNKYGYTRVKTRSENDSADDNESERWKRGAQQ